MRSATLSRSSTVARLIAVGAMLVTLTLVVPPEPALAANSAFFSTVCTYSHSLEDDPIVFPNQPGASHLHDFFGSTTANANSTYASLRAGGTTCDESADTAPYWVPALVMNGNKMNPTNMTAYYRANGKRAGTIEAPPPDLMILYDKTDSTHRKFSCVLNGAKPDPENGCPGGFLELELFFPDCWDGQDLGHDGDHMSHMAYSEFPPGGVDRECPSSHERPIPLIEYKVRYTGVTQAWSLSSGPADTYHGDFWNAWDQAELQRHVNLCLNSGLGAAICNTATD